MVFRKKNNYHWSSYRSDRVVGTGQTDWEGFEVLPIAITFAIRKFRAVAQPGSAHVWGAWGRKFESCSPDYQYNLCFAEIFFATDPLIKYISISKNLEGVNKKLVNQWQFYRK